MLKEKKWTLILSSAMIVLPVLAGLLLWDTLPERMVTHWGMDGQANGWSSRGFVVFGLPLLMLACHWLCILTTARDPKNKEQSRKVFDLVLWIVPVVSLFAMSLTYAGAFGRELPVSILACIFTGIIFILIGNYLPKCKQNHTIGIKIKWTLENEENWNATHRMAGKLWVAGGVLCLPGVFLSNILAFTLLTVVLCVMVAAPVFYSWQYHKKQRRTQ